MEVLDPLVPEVNQMVNLQRNRRNSSTADVAVCVFIIAFGFSILSAVRVNAQIRIPGPGIINTVAGDGTGGYSGDGGQATSAALWNPYSVTADAGGNLYVADNANMRVRKVAAATGVISTYAGDGLCASSPDGQAATSVSLCSPQSVAVDGAGNLYIADNTENRIRKVTASTGIISTVAGNGTQGYSGDGGAATSAELSQPDGVALDPAGNIYISDYGNYRVRKVTLATGIITTVAGNGSNGYSGDGGPATSAELSFNSGVALDSAANIYILDAGNSRIRKVTVSTGNISTYAGNGTRGYSGDGGPASAAELFEPSGVALDAAGNLYISDQGSLIRKVTASSGYISTVIGTRTNGFSGDGGPASSAEVNGPVGTAFDASGNFYISDSSNNRIRIVGSSVLTFSPPAGTYSGSQQVSISCNPSSGTSIWYTTNGYPANTAATLYTGPITVPSNTTIKAVCAYTGDTEVNVQTSSSNWKCNAPNAPITSNGWTCESSGGTSGSLSAFDFTPGSPAYMFASTEATGPTNALLFIHTPTTKCDACTTITQHMLFEPDQGPSVITRNELDMEQCCDVTTNALRQASLQCNASAGVWDINASGSWEHTTIGCNLPTTSETDVVYEAHWANGDEACTGGKGCMYLDALTVNGTRYAPLSNYCNASFPNCAQNPMVAEPGWNHWGAGNQHQIGLNGTTGCGQSQCTGGRHIYTNNVTTTLGTVGAASANYTIN